MANLSGVTPTWVFPVEPEFKNLITSAEGGKKQYQNLSTTPPIQWKLLWTGLTDSNFWTLYRHHYNQQGGYSKFSWKCVPSYINTNPSGVTLGLDVTVRYIDGTFKSTLHPHSWDLEVVVEKDI